LFLFVLKANAQDTILFFNGKVIDVNNLSVNDRFVTYNNPKKPAKPHRIDRYRVFSIKKQDSSEQVLYQPNPVYDDLSIEEMRYFIRGEQDAVAYYRPTLLTIAAAGVGIAAAPLGFYGLIVPPLFATITGNFSPNVSKQPIVERSLLDQELYIMGYQKKARDIRIRRSLIYGMSGFVVGFTAFAIFLNN